MGLELKWAEAERRRTTTDLPASADAERRRVLFNHLVAWRTSAEAAVGLRRVAREHAARERQVAGLLYALERRKTAARGTLHLTSPEIVSPTDTAGVKQRLLDCTTPPTPAPPETQQAVRMADDAARGGALEIDPASAGLRQRTLQRQFAEASLPLNLPPAVQSPTLAIASSTSSTPYTPGCSYGSDASVTSEQADSPLPSPASAVLCGTNSTPPPARAPAVEEPATCDAVARPMRRLPAPSLRSRATLAPAAVPTTSAVDARSNPLAAVGPGGRTSHIDAVLQRHGRLARERAGAATRGIADPPSPAAAAPIPERGSDTNNSPHAAAISSPLATTAAGDTRMRRRRSAASDASAATATRAPPPPAKAPPHTSSSARESRTRIPDPGVRPPVRGVTAGGSSSSAAARAGVASAAAPAQANTRQPAGDGAQAPGARRASAPAAADTRPPAAAAAARAPTATPRAGLPRSNVAAVVTR